MSDNTAAKRAAGYAAVDRYVTDGACMASSACQNPSLTYMALTARAVDHAVADLKGMSVE